MNGKTAIGMATLLTIATVSFAEENLPPITLVNNVSAKTTIFNAASRDRPLEIRSVRQAALQFTGADLARLIKAVDFKKQFALVFAWRGSGQDRQRFDVLESFPEQVVFSIVPGRTRDLRPHVKVYALRSNVKWRVRGGDRPRPPAPGGNPPAKEYVKLEVSGKLNNQVLAIGGETTGATVSSKGVVWELDFRSDARLRNRARLLHNKPVVVTGELNVKRGVEIRQRFIIAVAGLRAAGSSGGMPNANPYLTAQGDLSQPLQLRDAQAGFAGQTGQMWTVKTNGAWLRQPFLNRQVRAATAEGQLSKRQVRALAEMLAEHDLLGLPDRLGEQNPGANPHAVSISFGKERSDLLLRAGTPVPQPNSAELNPQERRFASLVRAIQSQLKPEAR